MSSISAHLPRRPARLLAPTLLIAVCFAAIALVAFDLMVDGPLRWHVRQPASVQGAFEALLLLGAWIAFACRPTRSLGALALLAGVLYLRRHNAELTLAFGLFYIETLFALGFLVRRAAGAKTLGVASAIPAFVLGISLWLLVCLTLSIFHLATPENLVLILLVGGAAMLLVLRKPVTLLLFQNIRNRLGTERMLLAALAGWFLVLAAKTANVLGYDTVWYIGQGDRLLAPNGSIFESLGLVSAVHYFPKLWETLLLPATALDEIRVQAALGIGMLAVFLLVVWRLAGTVQIPRVWRWWLLLVLATLPALANSALTLKADVISAALLAVMCLMLLRWLRWRRCSSLAYAAGAAAMACSAKLIAIPYVAVAAAVVAALEVHRALQSTGAPQRWSGCSLPAAVALSAGILVTLFFMLRTWLLAGVPTIGPDPLMSIWTALGLSLQEPAGTLRWTWPQQWSDVPALLRDWLFRPSSMPKMPISWTGNVWFALALCAVILAALGFRRNHRPTRQGARPMLLAMALVGLTLAIAWHYHSRGSDGNYFLFPVSMATVLAMVAVSSRLAGAMTARIALTSCLLAFTSFHAMHSFISTAWSPPGTRTLDARLLQLPWQPGEWRSKRLQSAGLGEIEKHLAARPRSERGVAYGPAHFQAPVLLPIAFEELRNLSYSRPEYTVNGQTLLSYMDRFEISHLLLPPEAAEVPDAVADYRKAVIRAGWSRLEDQGGVLYTRSLSRPQPDSETSRAD